MPLGYIAKVFCGTVRVVYLCEVGYYCQPQATIKASKTIKRHWDGIARWHESKINNGILEELSSVIQATRSKTRGYKTIVYV